MKFEINPQLILTKDEFETLDKASKLCRDMDEATQTKETEDGFCDGGCDICPFKSKCSFLAKDCIYGAAHRILKRLIDVAVVK